MSYITPKEKRELSREEQFSLFQKRAAEEYAALSNIQKADLFLTTLNMGTSKETWLSILKLFDNSEKIEKLEKEVDKLEKELKKKEVK